MDVGKKLVEILRKPIFPHELVDPIEAVADYLLDSGVMVQEWISVKDIDRLPTENKRVLVYGHRSGEIFKARRRGNKWYSSWDNVTEIECVSHWCDLPQPPKGE